MADKKELLHDSELSLRELVPLLDAMCEGGMERVRAGQAKREKEEEMYRERYGENWSEKYFYDKYIHPGEIAFARDINERIYYGNERIVVYDDIDGSYRRRISEALEARKRALYGGQYDRFQDHEPGDSEVAELLVKDALQTGKKEELPEELWEEYEKLRLEKEEDE